MPSSRTPRTTIRIWVLVLVVGFLAFMAGCSGKKTEDTGQPSSGLTESQRDSAIAASKLPGAKVVGRAIALSDSAKARAKRMDDLP